jgi:alpha,alpha-trehalase
MKSVAKSDKKVVRHDREAPDQNGNGPLQLRAVFFASGAVSGSLSAGQHGIATDLMSQPGTQALLRILRRNDIATLVIPPPVDWTGPDRNTLTRQAEKSGFSIGDSAVITDCSETAEAASLEGVGMVVLAGSAGPGICRRQSQHAATGNILAVRDTAELTWTPEHGLHIKTLDSLPGIGEPGLDLPAALAGSHPLLFLDYDGTLTPIIDDPAKAFLPQRVRETLAELGRLTTVTIVSGRDLELLRHMVDLDHLWYAGSHGFEIAGPAGSDIAHLTGAQFTADLDAAAQDLTRLLTDFPGHLLERKRMTIAVHYRNMAQAQAMRLQARVDELIEGFPTLHIGHGKMVMEVRPAIEWNKGEAVTWILSHLHASGSSALPIYIGDDLTDEDAFRTLAGRGLGIAVRHGETRATAADYAVDDTDAVHALLSRLVTELRANARERR